MRFRLILCATLALAAGPPATAQTFEEAVWTNFAIAVGLCIQRQVPAPTIAAQFRAAGFAETVERDTFNSDTTHIFTAPADTVEIELYYGEMPEHCIVESRHLDVSGASQIIDQVVPTQYPGFVRKVEQGPINPATGRPATCIRYEDPASEIGLVIGAGPGGGASGCVDNGSSVIYQTYRV